MLTTDQVREMYTGIFFTVDVFESSLSKMRMELFFVLPTFDVDHRSIMCNVLETSFIDLINVIMSLCYYFILIVLIAQ